MNDPTNTKAHLADPFYNFEKVILPEYKTGATRVVLSEVFKKITTWPADYVLHPTIKKIFEERIKNFNNSENLDWATM